MPQLTERLLRSANENLTAGRLEQAEAAYKALLSHVPNYVNGLLGYGILTCVQGRYAEAIKLLKKVIAIVESVALPHFYLGASLLGAQDIPAAAASFARAVELDPQHFDSLTNLGIARGLLGDFHGAVTALRKAAEVNPRSAIAHFNLGNALRQAGESAQAEAAYQAALTLDPKSPAVWCNLGSALLDQGRWVDAVAAYQQAVDLDPKLLPAWMGQGQAHRNNGAAEAATTAFRRATDVDPANADVWWRLGDALCDLGRYEESIDAFRRALDHAPDLPTAMVGLGLAYRLAFQTDAAIEVLTKAATQNPGSPDIQYELAMAYLEVGDDERSIEAFRRTISLDPDNLEAHHLLATELDKTYRYEEAEPLRRYALSRRPFVSEPFHGGDGPTPRMLLVSSGGIGNLPTRYLVPALRYRRTLVYPAYMKAEDVQRLPPFDLSFNLIGDPDVAKADLDATENLFAGIDKPFLNRPAFVRRTTRDSTPGLLGDIPGLTAPPTIKVDRAILAAPRIERLLSDAGIAPPILFRPFGSHGGLELRKIDDLTELSKIDLPYEHYYLTQFVDYRSEDGYYRKYRFLLIDGKIYFLHLAISQNWMIHYFNSLMNEHAWMRREEEVFFDNFPTAGSPITKSALTEVARRLELDYFGVDCGIYPDGSLLLFEANANMLLRLDDDPVLFPYKHRHIPKVVEAFEAMVWSRIGEKQKTPG